MTLEKLYAPVNMENKLKSLLLELAELEDFNPYKKNIITDEPPGGGNGKAYQEWYSEKKDDLEKKIESLRKQIAEKTVERDVFIDEAPSPEREIIRYRIVNNLRWEEIGELLSMERSTVNKRFWGYMRENLENFT